MQGKNKPGRGEQPAPGRKKKSNSGNSISCASAKKKPIAELAAKPWNRRDPVTCDMDDLAAENRFWFGHNPCLNVLVGLRGEDLWSRGFWARYDWWVGVNLGRDPREYSWRWAAGHVCMVRGDAAAAARGLRLRPEKFVELLAAELLAAGAWMVVVAARGVRVRRFVPAELPEVAR
ncbi:hypothetical protein [Methylocaldum sp.]|jgi:hypothetical protein|uniref:hypothetical protein n=1 Tax=Methylocaldum sp. TaxID=1969727 RepID=UPI00322031AE